MIDTEALRKKILDLAIQGKLTQQLPEDGNAEDLYAQIQEEKAKLFKEGKIKKEKSLPVISGDEIPFEIPRNWKWVQIGAVSAIVSKGTTPRGGNVAYSDSGVGFLRAENLAGYDMLDKSIMKFIDEETHRGFLKRSILEEGDVLISIAGTLGRTGLVRENDLPLNTNQAIAFIRLVDKALVESKYIAYILNSQTIQKELGNKKVDMAIPNLSLEVISKAIIPLPPIEEQKRVVGVVDAAFAQIDIVDILQQQYESDCEILKGKIIDVGIQGKLTEQLPEDGNAEDLYAQIQVKKAQLIKEGKIKKGKDLPEITEDEIPFEIPKSWKWVRFEDVARNISSMNHQITTKELLVEGEFPAVSQGAGLIDGFSNEKNKVISDIPLILFGDHTRNVKYIDFPFVVCADGTQLLDYISCDNKFYYYWTLRAANKISHRGYARHYTLLKKSIIPLPPLEEQSRIANTISEILSMIE